eukprot:scaffold96_cov167-Ochromonas_danica.AAC.26
MCCSVLTNVAGLGDEEKYFLLRLGTIQRVVDVFLRLESLVNTTLPDAIRIPCIELICGIVKSAAAPAISPSEEVIMVNDRKASLSSDDLQTFLNRVFLEKAILLCSLEMSMALQHLCLVLPAKDGQRIIEFVFDKVGDLTSQPSGTHPFYRAYFRVLSEILLGSDDVSIHQGVINKLANKAFHLSQRNSAGDAEFVYSATKLLHRLGISSASGHASVLKVRDFWKDIGARFTNWRNTAQRRQSTNLTAGGNQAPINSANSQQQQLAQSAPLGQGSTSIFQANNTTATNNGSNSSNRPTSILFG